MPTAASHNADAMKLDSKFFDRLRVKPDQNRLLRESCPACEWQGCKEPGLYPAPKGRGQEGKYHRFCLDHVREYNKSYNYFAGLPDEDVIKHQKDDTDRAPADLVARRQFLGAQPAVRATAPGPAASPTVSPPTIRSACSPSATVKPKKRARAAAQTRSNGSACASSISRTSATKADIKARFKELVKRLHPDHNKGDRGSEDKLREVIQAYNYLRQAGLA